MSDPIDKDDRGLAIPLLRRLSGWTLPWLPGWVTPNGLTWAGLGALALAAAGLALSRLAIGWLLLTALGLLVHALLDVLDGDLARLRGAQSPRGFFLDLVCDNLGAALVSVGLMLSPHATTAIVGIAFAAYSMCVVAGYMQLVMLRKMHMPEVGPTETEIGLAVVALATLALGGPCLALGPLCLSLFDVAALGWLVLAVRLSATLLARIYRQLDGPATGR